LTEERTAAHDRAGVDEMDPSSFRRPACLGVALPDDGARRGRAGPPDPPDRSGTPSVVAAVPQPGEATPITLEPPTMACPRAVARPGAIAEQFAVNACNGTRSAPWANRQPDVSLSEGEFVYAPNFRM